MATTDHTVTFIAFLDTDTSRSTMIVESDHVPSVGDFLTVYTDRFSHQASYQTYQVTRVEHEIRSKQSYISLDHVLQKTFVFAIREKETDKQS